MIDDIVFDDVFEAMRCLEKSNPILNLKDKARGYMKRSLRFNLMELPDGTIGAFPPNMMFRFYRGESEDFDLKYACIPSIYRINKSEEDLAGNRNDDFVLIDNLKITEFELVIKTFPQVKYAIKDYCNVDFRALAQHYELNTDLLDMSSDIAVAAFFATHAYDSENGYQIKMDGIGCIRVYTHCMNTKAELDILRLIGLQPFQRPGLQCAFGIRMNKEEDFSKLSGKVLFRQNAKLNRKLHEAFCSHGRNILFPVEDIDDVAILIENSNQVSQMAVQKFCRENNDFTDESVEKVLLKYKIQISERLTYSLSRQQRRRLEKEFKDRPYGDVELRSRVTF